MIQYNDNGIFGASANLSFDGNYLLSPNLKAWLENSFLSSILGTNFTLNCSYSNNHVWIMSSNITNLAFSNVPANGNVFRVRLFIRQSGGSYTITWPASVLWAQAGAPTLSTGSSTTDVIELLTYNGGTSWFAKVYGIGF
jgi:hypothetical protein